MIPVVPAGLGIYESHPAGGVWVSEPLTPGRWCGTTVVLPMTMVSALRPCSPMATCLSTIYHIYFPILSLSQPARSAQACKLAPHYTGSPCVCLPSCKTPLICLWVQESCTNTHSGSLTRGQDFRLSVQMGAPCITTPHLPPASVQTRHPPASGQFTFTCKSKKGCMHCCGDLTCFHP